MYIRILMQKVFTELLKKKGGKLNYQLTVLEY